MSISTYLLASPAEHHAARRHMVEHQLRARGISDERVLDSMSRVPRHRFVPEHLECSSYEDCRWPVANGGVINRPYSIARMCETAAVELQHRVLVVGTESGFYAAVLARACREIVSVEPDANSAARAQQALRELDIRNVSVVTGEAFSGYAAAGPYDVIIAAGFVSEAPELLLGQLAERGRLVIPLGSPYAQKLTVFSKSPGGLERSSGISCTYPPLETSGSQARSH